MAVCLIVARAPMIANPFWLALARSARLVALGRLPDRPDRPCLGVACARPSARCGAGCP